MQQPTRPGIDLASCRAGEAPQKVGHIVAYHTTAICNGLVSQAMPVARPEFIPLRV